jgi:LL-diaminopimelate aminotransferase
MKINPNYAKLTESYLFVDIARRVEAYRQSNPAAEIIRLGIGDVTRPLPPVVVEALRQAAAEQGEAAGFVGYGPEQGHAFLREAIAGYYAGLGVTLDTGEIFVSDGAKSDCGNLLELFAPDNLVLVPDPVYPAYVDANTMDGRRILYMDGTRDNGFLPMPNWGQAVDLIYLCSPNNPTGSAYSAGQLAEWVRYAYENGAIILFDAAYEAFVSTPDVPHSVYEVEGAAEVAVEICSLSKTAGFTGTRCGYTVVPKSLRPAGLDLNGMWNRRQSTKFNGVSYVVQRAASAVFTGDGLAACRKNIAYYKHNAALIRERVQAAGAWCCGGVNSPYIWLACPGGMGSWDFFELLLRRTGVVGTPGAGFGRRGEGYFRLTGFGDAEQTRLAAGKLQTVLETF